MLGVGTSGSFRKGWALIRIASRACIAVLLVFSLSWGCGTSAGTAGGTELSLEERVIALSRAYKFDQALEILADHSWANEQSPRMLMHYLVALLNARQQPPSSIKGNSVPKHVAAFASGYWAGLNGEWEEAQKSFLDLTGVGGVEAWGYAGLVELGLLADNPSLISRHLDLLENLVGSGAREWSVPYYRAQYRVMQGEYEGLEPYLLDHRNALHPADYAYLLVRLHVRQNRFGEARTVLVGLPKGFEDDLWAITAAADIIEAERGNDKYVEYMRRQVQRLPHVWQLQLDLAYRLINATEPAKQEEGLGILRSVSQRPIDVLTRLRIANAFLDRRKTEDFFKIMYTMTRSSYGWVPLLHATFARMHWMTTGTSDVGDAEIERARQMAPKNEEVLWMLYQLRKAQEGYYDAVRTLEDILLLEPHDVAALAALVEMYELTGKVESALRTAQALIEEKRFVSDHDRDRVLAAMVRIYCAKHENEQAKAAIRRISGPKTRKEAETSYERLCLGRGGE